MKVLVTGGREYIGPVDCLAVLNPSLIIEGGAKGADTLARNWAMNNGIHVATVPALWGKYGKGAGPIRNAAMLQLMPDICVAFCGGFGTEHMVKLCEDVGIPVWRPFG